MTLLKETATITKTGGRFRIGVITPGQGSSGVYPKETIEAAGRDRVFKAGTHMYLDHATEAQDWERPEGSLRDLVGVLAEDAHWDDDAGGLVAEARIYSHWKPVLEEMKDDIGVSIRASGEVKEDAGQRIVTRLTEARSVDFVTKAGRGGRILEVLESARMIEATAEEKRRLLSAAVKAEHGADTTWAWVRDYDDTHVWFDLETEDAMHTYEQTYTIDGVTITLTGTPTEVEPTTVYVPKTNPDPTGKDEEKPTQKEAATMATIQIEESAHTDLVTKAGRVEQLEADLAEAVKERDALKAAQAKEARRAEVSKLVSEAFKDLDYPSIQESLVARFTDSDATDEAIAKEAETVASELKTKSAGDGHVRGLGESRPLDTGGTDTSINESALPSWDELAAVKGA